MAELAPHTLVDDRYLVERRLGTGGMADVFLVSDQQLNRKVALKLLHRRFAEDPAFVERFRREAQAAAGLQHQNIVGIYDRGEYDGTYYIAMEYLPGRTLKDVIREEAPLDPVRAIDIALQILKAARFAHRRGIVHRDLKPHNVMVDDAGDAKVTDFGIARAGASDMTETGSIMGTAQYLSPEQAQGHTVTASSDLYSVGIVLYEMLTGRVPFDGEAAVTIALKHVSEAPLPPRQLNPRIPVELEQTVLWTLNKNASDRPAEADQLITVLEHVREAIVEGAAGRHTASMQAVAAGAAAGMPVEGLPELPPPVSEPVTNGSGQLQAVYVHNGDGTIPPENRDEQRRGWRPWLWGLLVLVLVCAAAAGGGGAGRAPARQAAQRAERQARGFRHRRDAERRQPGRPGLDGHAHRLQGARQRLGHLGPGGDRGEGQGGARPPGVEGRPDRPHAVLALRQGGGDRHQSRRRGLGTAGDDGGVARLLGPGGEGRPVGDRQDPG